mmetsp:Transcript_22232/g.33127  ORF Transcript_22232/g.33127 Transcript_22232/m.33127 type:complete len:575 (+) Transcript_22232:31-1755(+)
MTFLSALKNGLRIVIGLIGLGCFWETMSMLLIPRPQPLYAMLLGSVAFASILVQAQRSSQMPKPLETIADLLKIRFGRYFFWTGAFSLLQCSILMKSKAAGGIYMTWLTFGAAVITLSLWVLSMMGVADMIQPPGKKEPLSAICAQLGTHMQVPKRREITTTLSVVFLFSLWIYFWLLPWDDVAKHDSRWNAIRQTLTADGSDAANRAKMYWEEQKPLIMKSLKTNFTLHPYFSHTDAWKGARWDEMIEERVAAMGRELDQHGKKGFKIEKDKCDMMKFFQRHEIPIPRIISMTRNRDEAEKAINDILANPVNYPFPMFHKSCHLTQGSDKGMMPLKKSDFTSSGVSNKLLPWMNRKWAQRPTDNGRRWRDTMNRLLDTLEPGMAIQAPFKGMRISPYNTPLEVKVEVIWGRAYLGLFADYHDVIALRDGSLEFTCRDRACSQWWSHGNVPDLRLKWVVENGHMEAVWALAELAAQRIGIDEARIDIFIDPQRPERPVVNEISLSSGHEYMYHTEYLAEAWAGPHLSLQGKSGESEWPKPRVRATDIEVHMQPPPPPGGYTLLSSSEVDKLGKA